MSDDDLNQKAIQQLAYRLWQERGSPTGSPEVDWFHAEQELVREQPSPSDLLYAFSMEPAE